MSPRRLAKAALLGLVAGAVTAAGACSLILPAGDLDAQYDAAGGGSGTSISTSAGTGASTSTGTVTSSSTGTVTSSSSGAGGAGPGCCADGGCESDPANCGTCGHVCPPGPPPATCNQGRCSAGALVTTGVSVFTCGGGSVYYYSSALNRIPTDGGPSCSCPTEKVTDVITVAEGHVLIGSYDTSGGRHVSVMPAACCQVSDATNIADAGPWTSPPTVNAGITTDGTRVYWLDNTHVMRAPIGGGAAETVYTWPGGKPSYGPSGLALTGNDVLANATQENMFYVIPADGGNAQTPMTPYSSYDVQTNGTFAVWFSTSASDEVYLVPTTTALAFQSTPALPGAPVKADGVAIDDDYVYAVGTVGDGGAAVLRWTLTDPSAAPTTLETMPAADAPHMLCADGLNLFWLDGSGAVIQGDKKAPP